MKNVSKIVKISLIMFVIVFLLLFIVISIQPVLEFLIGFSSGALTFIQSM